MRNKDHTKPNLQYITQNMIGIKLSFYLLDALQISYQKFYYKYVETLLVYKHDKFC